MQILFLPSCTRSFLPFLGSLPEVGQIKTTTAHIFSLSHSYIIHFTYLNYIKYVSMCFRSALVFPCNNRLGSSHPSRRTPLPFSRYIHSSVIRLLIKFKQREMGRETFSSTVCFRCPLNS